MNFDNSWDAVLKPGKSNLYFDKLGGSEFEAGTTSYSKINSWWLAELCRLIYRENSEESGATTGPTREEILATVNLHEVEFFNEGATEAALIKPTNSDKFAALIFRGTTDLMDWLTDFRTIPIGWKGGGFVHKGFAEAIELVETRIRTSLNQNVPANCPLFVAGHSLGAALATLAASLFKPRVLYDFGSPRVGDRDFARTLSGVSIYRVVNNRDVVTTVPPPLAFHHVGELHYITHVGDVLTDPDDDMVARDRLKRDRLAFFPSDWHKLFTDAPEPIADHAPVNYVAHLERNVGV